MNVVYDWNGVRTRRIRVLKIGISASPKQSQLARALRELGRIERSLLMIEWYSSPALRRRCQAGLNKGEAAHKLKRAVFSTSETKSATGRSKAKHSAPPG